MLFHWFDEFLRFIIWLFRRPTKNELARIDPNAKCPACGAKSGTLKCVRVTNQPTPDDGQLDIKMFSVKVQHTCNVDGAIWYEDPIVKVNINQVLPSR